MENEIFKENLISLEKHNNLMELFPKLLNIKCENFKMTPSEFINEMNLTTQERYKKLVHMANTMKTPDDGYPPQFMVLPNILLFQNFEARESYTLTLEVKNIGKSLLPLKMICPNSVHFSAHYGGVPMNKVAPGLSVEYKIIFTPKEARDYSHHLMFKSKETTFYVPILAIGPRAMLDIPDKIILKSAPVKITHSKIIVVRNIGSAPAVFNLITDSENFRVSPSKGILGIQESMPLNISFESSRAGEVSAPLFLLLESGEKLEIGLHGTAENIAVRLDKNSLCHEDTFMGLKRCKVIRLINNSSSIIKFAWKKNEHKQEDLHFIEKIKEKYEQISERDILEDAKVKFYDICNSQRHKISCERILKDELRSLTPEKINFSHEAINIVPEGGEVWPKTSTEISVSFEPKSCGPVNAVAYLEVTGREARLPLRIKGNGLGPKIVLSLKTLDIDYIYLCSLHKYEVIAENRGDIPGSIEYMSKPLIFGGKIEVSPDSKLLEPGQCTAFVISFTSNRQGEFTESLSFVIKESGDQLFLILKGKIISPTLHFDIRQIDFGTIAVGFPEVREVTLNNLSMVPVKFSLRILSDGQVPSLSYKQFAKFTVKPALPQYPKEFSIDPQESVVEPFSSKKVTLTLTANKSGQFLSNLVADMWDSESGSISCPIHFHSHIASLTADPDAITIPFCFINFPYTRSITIRNLSKVPGFFYIVPSNPNTAESNMTCSASIPQGVIEPRGSTKIDVTVITSALGRQVVPINLMTFGHERSREVCLISCVGQGPVVTVSENSLSWGDLPLLQEARRTLMLSNESPIPAFLTIFLAKSNSPWAVSPSNLTLSPEKTVNLNIRLNLIDRGKFRDTLKVNVHNGKVLQVLLSATGVGSSLRIIPDIKPKYDLGTLFSQKKYQFEIQIENHGTKSYGLVWSPFPEFKAFANLKFMVPQEFIFKIEPPKMDISCGESKKITLEVQGTSTGHFRQNFYCFAIIGGLTKELHFTSEIFAEFVEPLISFDKYSIDFWYNIGSVETEEKLEDQVLVTNMSVLPICVNVSANHPFCLEKTHNTFGHSLEMNLDGNESKMLRVRFTVETSSVKHSKTFYENLEISFKENSKKCSASLKGEVNYPNVVILPKIIDFNYIPVSTEAYREIFVVNISPLIVHYEIRWNLSASKIYFEHKTCKTLDELPFPDDVRESTESGASYKESSDRLERERLTEELEETTQNLHPPSKPVPKMPEIIVSNSAVRDALLPLVRSYYRREEEFVDIYNLARSYDAENFTSPSAFGNMCDITPFYGRLEAFSSQTLMVRFGADAPVDAHMEALVLVASGPTEVVTIKGKSSEIAFELSAVSFDFGKQLFCQTMTQVLKIENKAAMAFSYEVITDKTEECHPEEDFPLGIGALTINPRTGKVDSYSQSELSVRYHAGVPGTFDDKFQLQIAYLEPIIIRVTGCGVFPQVHIWLPRPGVLNVPPEEGYLAVASITPDWLLTRLTPTTDTYNPYFVKPYRSQEGNLDSIPEDEEVELHQEGWEIVRTLECLPSEVDIQLALERVLALNLIRKDSLENTTFAVYARTIPQFYVPAYEIDFGVAVIGRELEESVRVTNYGPLPVIMYGIFESHLKEGGIQVRLKNRNELKIGADLSFTVSFCPRKSKYKERVQDVHSVFHFEVYHGPKIPIEVIAKVTYPHLISSMSVVDYAQVICGCCKIITLKLKNPGLVTAFWSLMFTSKYGEVYGTLPSRTQDGRSMFHLNQSFGSLEPKQYCNVQISFKPEHEGCFSTVLWIQVKESLEQIKIVLLGEGIEPKLKISHRILEFDPTAPYPQAAEKILVVENPCSFPIEFYFPTFDEQIFEEDKILRAITNFYGVEEILMPIRKAGETLPVEFINFYHMLLEDLNRKFLELEKEKANDLEKNASDTLFGEDDPTASSSQMSFSEKKRRKLGKALSRSRTSTGTKRLLSATFDAPRDSEPDSIFERKTSEEIEEMLSDYVKSISNEERSYDPIQAALKHEIPATLEEEYREGTLVIFHGAPFTNSAQLANKAGLTAGLMVLSIDRIVLEEAALGRCQAGLSVKELIEQSYWDHIEGPREEDQYTEAIEMNTSDAKFVTEFAEIQRKFNALLAWREILKASKGKGPKTSSAKSDGSKKLEKDATINMKTTNSSAPVANITEELVLEILKFRISLEVTAGVIIEGLNSVFLSGCLKALVTVLKAAGNIKDIIVVFLLHNYNQYITRISNIQTEQEKLKLKVRDEILAILEEEPEEVFQSLELNPEDKEEIRSIFISQRQEWHNLFEKKKDAFYETQKLKRLALKNGTPMPSLPLNTMAESSTGKGQKEKRDKEKKKDASKVIKTSEVSGRSGSEAKSAKNKRDAKEGEFLSFELELMEMITIIENWDQRIGAPIIEGVSDMKARKIQAPRKSEVEQVTKGSDGRGVFLWLADGYNTGGNCFLSISYYLRTVLQEKRVPVESENWPLEPTDMTFSVAVRPTRRIKPAMLDTFIFSAMEAVLSEEDAQDDVHDQVSSSSLVSVKSNGSASQLSRGKRKSQFSLTKRRGTESRSAIEAKNVRSRKTVSGGILEYAQVKVGSRWVLQPGESVRYRVKYFPVETGRSEQMFPINVVNWENGYVVCCVGTCDIPAVDMTPEVLFPSVALLRPLAGSLSPTYIYSENAYDFGSIITVQGDGRNKGSSKTAVFTLLNKSSLPVNLTIVLAQDVVENQTSSSHIQFHPDKAFLLPGENLPLSVTARPTKNEPILEVLMIEVKDNPKVELIRVKCEGVKANVTVDPKSVNFDRLLLYRKDFRRVTFTNNNSIPLFITLTGLESMPPQFSFSGIAGWIPPLGTLLFEIRYDATEVQFISEQPLQVHVFDSLEAEEPVQQFPITISVEAYDAALDIIFSNKDDDHIDFGKIRVENTYTNVLMLKNTGKYPLGFRVNVEFDFLAASGNEQFLIAPQEGKLIPGKSLPLTVTFVAQTEVSWKRVRLFQIVLMEPFDADDLIAIIPIEVSAESFFARYEIKPQPEFNFGPLRKGSTTTASLLIENMGCFPLSYSIEKRSSGEGNEPWDERSTSKPSASSKDKGEKGDKWKKPTGTSMLKVGPFEIFPSVGVAEVGETTVVSIICRPDEVKSYEESVVVFVSQSPPHLKKGTQIDILAESCIPAVSFRDFRIVFREHFVSKNEADFKCRPKFGTYTSFTEDNTLFSFKNVPICKMVEARLQLPNSGLIQCQLTAQICPSEDKQMDITVPKGEGYFKVFPSELVIEPYTSGTLTLTFRPEALEVYRARLKIILQMPDNFDDIVEVINLWGNGILPQIEIIEPSSKLGNGETLVNFPPTFPGHYSTSTIAFSNVGLVDCKVILEIYKCQIGIFTLSPKSGTERMLKIWELANPIDHTAIVSISPGQIAEFNVTFVPQELKSYSSEIKLFIVDNPFENWKYILVGEVIFEEVVIEKIRMTVPFLSQDSHEQKPPATGPPGQYLLNFGDCFVKKKAKALLRLANKTKKDYFRFEWEELQNISISPSTGHLYPNSYKEILLVFYPDEPMDLNEAAIVCTMNKIHMSSPPEVSWDSRLVCNQKMPNLELLPSPRPVDKKVVPSHLNPDTVLKKMAGEEPEFEVVPESERLLLLRVSGTADYARLAFERTQITFKNTFMFQTCIYPLILENCGNVALEYKLKLKSVTASPLREDKMFQVGHSLLNVQRPQSSFQPNSERSHCLSSSELGSVDARNRCPRPATCGSSLDLEYPPLPSGNRAATAAPPTGKIICYNPFIIENLSGQIKAKEKVSCNIIFSPMDINEYRAVISLEVTNLHPESILPEIEVTASSVLPHCHFNIPESDYLKSGRRDFSRPGPVGYTPGLPLHPETKCIEIKVLGIGQTIPIKFHVINPTDNDYTFSWTDVTQIQADVVSSFHCSPMEGRIQAGRQLLMVFHFFSQKIGIAESFWKFAIPKYGVETLFLFVADVREPAVSFLVNHVNLRPTFIGSSSSDILTLVNHEDSTIDFCFLAESLFSEGRLNTLKVEPMFGQVSAHSEVSIRITFTGKTEGKIIFYLKCKVKCITESLAVSVEATTYAVRPLLSYEDLKKTKHFADPTTDNFIDFGSELCPNRPETISMTFTSLSKTSFYYEWEFDGKFLESRSCKMKFSVKNGHVASFSRGKCNLTIEFYKKSELINFPVKLKIRRGPVFNFKINARASTPLCEFSFDFHDFGYCFVQEKNVRFYEVLLFFRNKDNNEAVLECNLQESSAFSFALPKAVIPPNEDITISITFHPENCIPYADKMKFTINGVHEKIVTLKGHGTDFRVNLADPKDTTVSLGAVRVGKTSHSKFSLVNNSLCPATVLVGFFDQLPVNWQCLAWPLKNLVDLSQDHRLSGTVSISPSTVFTVKPGEVYTLDVTYTPHEKSAPFSEMVSIQHQETVKPLCILTGCCLGPEISLDRGVLNFGAVVKSCISILRLKIVNSGSIGARFEWNVSDLDGEYFISPESGYCCPESNVTIQVTFCPTTAQNCIRKKVECKLFFADNETHPSLFLSLIGDCVDIPEPLMDTPFKCFVREKDTKTLEIENSSGTEWQLVPLIRGDYFRGFEALIVPPLSTAQYEVTYCPLTMTEEGQFHEGTVFFRLPNGQGILHRLKGTSLPPKAEDIITREVPCKTKYVELLKMRNWLQYPQRFKANILCISNDNQKDPVWTCGGFENIELPALGHKEYSLNFFSYNMGHLRFHVKFVNEETKEYVWYDVTFNVTMCSPLEVITLKSGVRQSCKSHLKLENPLKKTIKYKLESTSPEIYFDHPFYDVPPEQTIYAEFSFVPIHVREQSEKLTVTCPELGEFPRELRLISVEVQPETKVIFETPLGTSQTQEILVKNVSHLNAVFYCKIDSEDFSVSEEGSAIAGQSAVVFVTYEPSEFGSKEAILRVESEQAGRFAFQLIGVCVKPKARGPFEIKQGLGVNIPFKNVFRTIKEFHMYVDNPAFQLKTTLENIPPKEESNIYVELGKGKRNEKCLESRFPLAGQLVVECFNPYVKWQYYLKGFLET